MENRTNPEFASLAAGTLAWWREAGVDLAYVDEACSWLAPAPAEAAAAPERPEQRERQPGRAAPSPPADLAPPPADLEAFRTWWMTAPELDHGHVAGRVPPQGSAGAALMVVAPSPEVTDRDRLLSGSDGRLLDAFLAASGLSEQDVYRASMLPCHAPGADWSQNAATLSSALTRHIALVRPQRLLVLGFVILPLLGHDLPHGTAVSRVFNHESVTVPMLAVRRIPAQASQPRWKSALWRAWLDWSA